MKDINPRWQDRQGKEKEEAEVRQRPCLSPKDPARSSLQEPSIPALPKFGEVQTGPRKNRDTVFSVHIQLK